MLIVVYFLCTFPRSIRSIVFTDGPSNNGCFAFSGTFTECVPISKCSLYLNRGVLLKDRPRPCSIMSKSELHVCCPKIERPRYECGNPRRTLYSPYGFARLHLPLGEARPGRPVSLFQTFNTRRFTRNTLGDRDSDELPGTSFIHPSSPKSGRSPSEAVGGFNTALGKWPWIALFGLWNYKELTGWFCGGTLISPDYVLTAAHCIGLAKSPNAVVRIGDHNLSTNSEVLHQQRNISRVIVHEQYKDSASQNDIALVKLQRPVQLTDAVRPICLPDPNTSHGPDLPVSMAGWGVLKDRGTTRPYVLQEVSLKLFDETECESIYSQSRSFNTDFPGGFQATKLCAVSVDDEPRGSCNGDSGGPLMLRSPVDGMFELVGVVSTGVGCGHPDYPGIYTKVSAYVNWIVSNAI